MHPLSQVRPIFGPATAAVTLRRLHISRQFQKLWLIHSGKNRRYRKIEISAQ